MGSGMFDGLVTGLLVIGGIIGGAIFGLVWLCVWWFTPTPEPTKPVVKKVYVQHCQNCGESYQSARPSYEPIKSCPRCPLDVCEKGLGFLLSFGTVQGIANAQPENAKAQEDWAKMQADMEAHWAECEQCRKSLGDRIK